MLDIAIILLYFIILLVIGIVSAGKIATFRDYALGYKSYSWIVITATLSASFLGGGFTMGISSKAYLGGIAAMIGIFGFSLKELLVSKLFAKRFAQFPDAISIGDIMQSRYGVQSKVVSGILGAIVCSGIVGVQLSALGYVVNAFFGIPQEIGLLIGAGLLIFYTVLGGLSAIILTDVIQFGILVIGIPLTCILGLKQVGGLGELMTSLPASYTSLPSEMLLPALALFLTFLLGETLVPPYVQRLMIGKGEDDSEKGTFASGILSVPIFICSGLIGMIAYKLFPGIDSEVVMPTLINHVLPVGLKGLVVAGVLSAIMSTADSFLQAGAISFVHDALKPLKLQSLEKRELLWFRATTLGMGLLAIVSALMVKGLIDLCLYAWTFWSPVMLVPFAAVLLGVSGSKNSFYLSGIIGSIAALSTGSLLWGVLCSFLSFVIVLGVSKRSAS